MKFLTDCKKFLAAVKAAGRFSTPRSTLPALECVKVGARAAHLYAEGNDVGTGARLAFPAEIEEDSPALLPPRVVEKMLAGADGVVRVSIQNGTARVWTGSSEFSAEVPRRDEDDVALSMRRFVPAGYTTALGESVNVTPIVIASALLATGTPDAILRRVEGADATLVVKAADFGREFQAVVMLRR